MSIDYVKVLGVETSCDETAAAIYDSEAGLLAHAIHSQIRLHVEYGGVVPELACRDHQTHLLPLIEKVSKDAKVSLNQLDGIAYTAGPGLVGALLVGACLARSMGWALNIPTVGIHHMEAHLLSPMLEENKPDFPFLALLVSGGHTLLVSVKSMGEYRILGQSVDDAAGEAFDKTARLLGLGYPGGPAISALAEQCKSEMFEFPRPMTNRPGLDFSFSGLKTFTMNTWNRSKKDEQTKIAIASAFQKAVVDTLVIKCKRAIKQTRHQALVVAGGVSANRLLRTKLSTLSKEEDIKIYYPRLEFCMDNGAMIAYAGHERLQCGEHDTLNIQVHPRWSLNNITSY